jgi:hypothetical protein
MLQGGYVIGYFDDVFKGCTRGFFQFEEQEVGKGRLRALYLGGKERLSAHIGVKEYVRIGQEKADAVKPAKRQRRSFEQPLTGVGKLERRIGWKWIGDEGTDVLAACPSHFITSGKASLQVNPLN